MINDGGEKQRTTESRGIFPFRLRTLLLVSALAVLSAMWFGWISPRLEFENHRAKLISQLDWGGKDSEAEYRTNQIKDALEQSTYDSPSMPKLVYAMVRKRGGFFLVDWIAKDLSMTVKGIAISGDEALELPLDPNNIVPEGAMLFSTALRKIDHPEKWSRLIDAGNCQAPLMIEDNQQSNQIKSKYALSTNKV